MTLAASDSCCTDTPPPYLIPKAFERKDLSPDFGLDLIWTVANKKPGFCRALYAIVWFDYNKGVKGFDTLPGVRGVAGGAATANAGILHYVQNDGIKQATTGL